VFLGLAILLGACASPSRSTRVPAITAPDDSAVTAPVPDPPVATPAPPPVAPPTLPPPVGRRPDGVIQQGQASWYGRFHHGRATANGERFNMYALTAAHRTLPFGTRLLVTNLENDRTVEVRINDRGPYVGARILDLSYAAARALGAVGAGVIPVTLRVVPRAADRR
jgi:peptidoglycan lytic transglycosylase